jgi:glutamate--cysteine ligase catalytic subunit
LRAKEILETLIGEEEEYLEEVKNGNTEVVAPFASWKPEYGRFMVEGTPFFPYEGSIKAMLQVEDNMKKRYVLLLLIELIHPFIVFTHC